MLTFLYVLTMLITLITVLNIENIDKVIKLIISLVLLLLIFIQFVPINQPNLKCIEGDEINEYLIPIESCSSIFERVDNHHYRGYFITPNHKMKCYYKFEITSIDMPEYVK